MVGHDEVDGWHKSSASGDGGCVEVRVSSNHVFVRDAKDHLGTVLTFSSREWNAFLTGVRLGEFDISDAEVS